MKNQIQELLEKKLKKFIKKINKKKEKVILSGEVEKIHKFRVNIRKIRTILEEFINEIKIDLQMIESLRKVFKIAGKVRDYDIMIQKIQEFTEEIKKSLANQEFEKEIENWLKELSKKRKQKYQELVEYLSSKKYKDFESELNEFSNYIKFKNFYISDNKEISITHLCASKYYKLLSHSYWIENSYNIQAIHHFRRQIKKTRYYLQIFKKFYKNNEEFKFLINSLKEQQELTGTLVDIYVIKEKLKKADFNSNYFLNWIEEKEKEIFYQFIQKKEEFYKKKEDFLNIILYNCKIQLD